MPREYRTIEEAAGPLLLVKDVENVTYGELAEIRLKNGDLMIISGVGRTNASMALLQLFQHGCDLIINIGTCGSTYPKMKPGAVVIPEIFYDGDFTLVSENYKMYDGAALNPENPSENAVRIFSVSYFSTNPLDSKPYLVDCESYAIAALCKAWPVPSLLIKVVSDNADEEAELTFEENVQRVIQMNIPDILKKVE